MGNSIITLVMVALAVSSATFTITSTGIFKEVREILSKIHHKVEELIHCPWCLSHWVGFLFVAISGSTYKFTGAWFIDFVMSVFFITAISGAFHYVLLRAYEPVAKAMAQRQIEKLRNNK
jgi:hypothetical protein